MTAPQPRASDAAAVPQDPTQHSNTELSTHSVAATPPAATTPTLAPGSMLGPYRLIGKLGEGGMGAVYKAQHEHLDMTVAIKVLPPHFTAHADSVARFKREMKAVGKLHHPHIVQAHDAGEIGGTYYIAMEYVDGSDLTQVVKSLGPFSVANACRVLRQSALALVAAHEAGLVHRDIKPSNLLVTRRGQIKLLDLGLARLAGEAEPGQGITTAGQTFGTPDYMAPEQWDDAHGVDGRCDLYALGCTLFFLLTGRAPFAEHKSMTQKLKAHGTLPPPDLRIAVNSIDSRAGADAAAPAGPIEKTVTLPQTRVIPDGLVAIYDKLLAKRPEDRFQSADELVAALDNVLASANTQSSLSVPRPEDMFAALTAATLADEMPTRRPTTPTRWRLHLVWLLGAAMLLAGIIIVVRQRDDTTAKIPVAKGDKVETAADDRDDEPLVLPWATDKPPDYAKEREVAEWVLSIGGSVTVAHAASKWQPVAKPPLPAGDVTLREVNLSSNTRIADRDLARFQSLANLQNLSLKDCRQITDTGVAELAQVASLEFINLQRTALTDAGLATLVHLPRLRNLTLNATKVTAQGAMLLAGAKRLEILGLISTPVTIQSLRAVQGLPLTQILISGSEVNYSELRELATLFPGLRYFDGRVLRGEMGMGLSPLASLANLEQLCVLPEQVTTGPPHHLAQFPRLRRLNMSSSPFPTGLAARLDQLPTVTEMSLVGPGFDEVSFRELCANTTLEQLLLASWSGGDAELLQLGQMKKLRELHLEGTQVTAAGAAEFHKRRPDVAITGDFDIPADPSIQAAKEREVAEWVLSIGGKVRVDDAKQVRRSVSKLPLPDGEFSVTRIDLYENPRVSDADIVRLHSLARLQEVHFIIVKQITDAGVAELAKITSLTGITLQQTAVTDAGLAQLVRLPQLHKLYLHELRVTDKGVMLLAAAERIEALRLGGIPATIQGLRALRNLPLSELSIASTQVRYSDLREIATLFPGLRIFDGRNLKGDVGAGQSPLAELGALEQVYVEAGDVTAGAPHHLQQFPRLQRLDMSNAAFPAGLAAELEKIPQVTALGLRAPQFADGAFAELCANTTLERLDLRTWSGDDAQLLQLTAMKKLRELYLERTQVTAAGAQEFHKRRPDVAITGDFNIPAAPSIQAAKEREVAEWVLSIGGKVSVDIGGKSEELTRQPLPAGEYPVTRIELPVNSRATDGDLARLSQLSRLRILNLYQNPQITDAGVVHLEGLKSLREVNLSANGISDQGLRSLGVLSELTKVSLTDTQITDDGLRHLAGLTSLESLFLRRTSRTKGVSDAGLARLSRIQSLKTVDLSSPQITDRGVAAVLNRNPNVQSITVDNIDRISSRTLAPLEQAAKLTHVYLSGDQLTADGLASLRKLPLLDSVIVGIPVTDGALANLNQLRNLKRIEVYYFKEGQSRPQAGYVALAQHPGVEQLVFRGSSGSPTDDELLGLAKVPTLNSLRVSFDETYSPRNYSTAWIPKFRAQRPDVALDVDGTVYPPEKQKTADQTSTSPASPSKPADRSPAVSPTARTIRVGPEAGMVATLKQALADANGGDTIEIATDEPLMITEPLAWSKPGPLTIRAAEGKRPILVAAGNRDAGRPTTLEFGVGGTADLVTLRGLTILNNRSTDGTVITTSRSLEMLDTICLIPHPLGIGVFAKEGTPEITFDKCYCWRIGDTRPFTYLATSRIAITNCLFTGRAIDVKGTQPQSVVSQHVSYLGGWHAWQLSEAGKKEFQIERNLYGRLKVVFSFGSRNEAFSPAELAVARRQLAQYQGVQNGYFQCDRLAPNVSDKAENDLAAWQSFTNNGEKNPQFVDPQFVRPEVVELAKTKLLPPKAFALKATSPLRKLNIGCDVTQLPDLPPRLYELLPAEIRFDLKP